MNPISTASRWAAAGAIVVITAAFADRAASPRPSPANDSAETVLVTFHVAVGREQALLQALRDERRFLESEHDVSDAAPYLLLRGSDPDGKTYFVESFTWRDASIPDHASSRLQAIWDRLNALCPSVGQRPGIEIAEVDIVAAK